MSQETNIFEAASRQKLRFVSNRGELSVEELWELPLTSARGTSLDSIAIVVNRELKAMDEESFVTSKVNIGKRALELRLEILKHIINVRQEENAAAVAKQANASRVAQLKEALAKKSEQALEGMTQEQLEAEIKQLGG